MSEAEQAKAQELAELCREIPAGDQDYIKGIMVGLTKAAQKYEQKAELARGGVDGAESNVHTDEEGRTGAAGS